MWGISWKVAASFFAPQSCQERVMESSGSRAAGTRNRRKSH
jgi:hypothetical protein